MVGMIEVVPVVFLRDKWIPATGVCGRLSCRVL